MSEALLRSREALVWNRGALELWRPLGDLWVVVTEWRPVWFGMDFARGRYRIEWMEGIVLYNPTWFSLSNNIRVLTSLSIGQPDGAGIGWPVMQRFFSQDAAEAAAAGQALEWEHAGGPIGMGVWDPVYADNSGGARFRLLRV